CPCLRHRVCLAGCRCGIDRADSWKCLVMGAGTVYVRPSLEHTPKGTWLQPLPHDVADADRGFCQYLPDSRPTDGGSSSARVADRASKPDVSLLASRARFHRLPPVCQDAPISFQELSPWLKARLGKSIATQSEGRVSENICRGGWEGKKIAHIG